MEYINKDEGFIWEPSEDGPMFDEYEDGSIDCPNCFAGMEKTDDYFWECKDCGNTAWVDPDGKYHFHWLSDYNEIY